MTQKSHICTKQILLDKHSGFMKQTLNHLNNIILTIFYDQIGGKSIEPLSFKKLIESSYDLHF